MDCQLYGQLYELAHAHAGKEGFYYIFDWRQTLYLHDSGVPTLLRFWEWAVNQGATIEFANLNATMKQRLSGVVELAPLLAACMASD